MTVFHRLRKKKIVPNRSMQKPSGGTLLDFTPACVSLAHGWTNLAERGGNSAEQKRILFA